MIKLKYRLVRSSDELFTTDRLVEKIAERVEELTPKARIVNTNSGIGFDVQVGTPKTLRGLFFNEGTGTREGLMQVKKAIDG